MSETINNITIKNIYYMLTYAWSVLREKGFANIQTEEFENIYDMFASVLCKGIDNQIKRGLNKEYNTICETSTILRGKIDVSASVKNHTIFQGKIVCHYDDFNINTLMNRILKTTIYILIKSHRVHNSRVKILRKYLLILNEVELIDTHIINWSALKYHKNNSTYHMLMSVCYLTIKGLLLTTEKGYLKFQEFLNDDLMSHLYEKFVLEYFRKEFPEFNPNPSQVKWNLDEDEMDVITFLPKMTTDITLTYGIKTLIIDTKFYRQSLQYNVKYDTSSVISSNLYQIFTYVKNWDREHSKDVSGMLLYAKTDNGMDLDERYSMSGNKIYVRTLDLNQDFACIKIQLNRIAEILQRACE